MNLIPLPAFNDNYIWLLHNGQHALVVDPGDSQVVLDALAAHNLNLSGILVTHHHGDHTGGVQTLRQLTQAPVYGPAKERLPEPVIRVSAGDAVELLGISWQVLDVPGHTAGHVAYLGEPTGQAPVLFCGDTLFSAGCGRLFEGSPAQMLASLQSLAALAPATRVCCAHEYTLSGLDFAQRVEPDNLCIQSHIDRVREWRGRGVPSLPSSIGLERDINPFLRSHLPSVIRAVQSQDASAQDPASVFAALRTWKNQF